MLGHKASLSKFNKIEILSSTNLIFSSHNAMRLEINYKKKRKKKTCKKHKHMEAKKYVLNNKWVVKKLEWKQKKYLETW